MAVKIKSENAENARIRNRILFPYIPAWGSLGYQLGPTMTTRTVRNPPDQNLVGSHCNYCQTTGLEGQDCPRSAEARHRSGGGVVEEVSSECCSVLGLLALALALGGVEADLLVVLLEGREVLAGLGELAFLHALADVPVDERPLGVHLRFA